tara:strand:+ start:17 stop:1060 length:1044 start_codon:yes stop_codon:yes gene_type:complete
VATYYDINGQKVQNLASDPSPVQVGQVWYNTTSNTAKVRGFTVSNTWASGATFPAAGPAGYISYAGGCGTLDATLSAGGYNPTTSGVYKYDGTSWTTGTSMPVATQNISLNGTQTAAFAAAGNPTNINLNFDGSTWTYAGTPPQSLSGSIFYSWWGMGTQTASLATRGGSDMSPTGGYTETWDGTSWTALGGTLNTGRQTGGANVGAGTTTDGLIAGGYLSGPAPEASQTTNATEHWDGTSWSSVNPINQTRRGHMMRGDTSTEALIACGVNRDASPDYLNTSETYDGTSWTTQAAVPFGKLYVTGSGGNGSGFVFGGDTEGTNVPIRNATAEWTGSYAETKTITTS